MKYNLQSIMLQAWKNFRKGGLTFSEALHRAWISAKAKEVNEARILQAKEIAKISEETHTWSEWRNLGYKVIHGMKALFGVDLVYGSKGNGAIYKARFFGRSQVEAVTE